MIYHHYTGFDDQPPIGVQPVDIGQGDKRVAIDPQYEPSELDRVIRMWVWSAVMGAAATALVVLIVSASGGAG